jgi:hypothetical protein
VRRPVRRLTGPRGGRGLRRELARRRRRITDILSRAPGRESDEERDEAGGALDVRATQ